MEDASFCRLSDFVRGFDIDDGCICTKRKRKVGGKVTRLKQDGEDSPRVSKLAARVAFMELLVGTVIVAKVDQAAAVKKVLGTCRDSKLWESSCYRISKDNKGDYWSRSTGSCQTQTQPRAHPAKGTSIKDCLDTFASTYPPQ